MIWIVTEEMLYDRQANKHAGGKAREDIRKIAIEWGASEIKVICPQTERNKANVIKKIGYHYTTMKIWEDSLGIIEEKDTIIIQFPVINHTLLFKQVISDIKKRKIHVVALVHDLDCVRLIDEKNYPIQMKWRMNQEEIKIIHLFDKIIVHNEKMKELMMHRFHIPEERLYKIEIFDYLIDKTNYVPPNISNYKSCVIAGNLVRKKSGYIYNLPDSPSFHLYGVNYEEQDKKNIHYHGSYLADDLPMHISGGFGLVWDGNSVDTCAGATGEYLKYNNPHKTSLYLACGIPVIIWEQAALAQYIQEKKVGLTVSSLRELASIIDSITPEKYEEYKRNASKVSEELRNGFNTKRVLSELRHDV